VDRHRFDDLTRQFASGWSRRRLVATVLGLAPVGAGILADGAAAAPRQPRCRSIGVGCTRGQQCCIGHCQTDRSNPRSRRNRCGCPVGQVVCGGTCVDLGTSNAHCGQCGAVCGSLETCCSGVCVALDSDEDHCGACDVACDTGEICCDGSCSDLAADEANCGACGVTCDTGETCVSGVCLCGGVETCDSVNGETCCSGVCTELGTVANCTACGDACDTGASEICNGDNGCGTPQSLCTGNGYLTTDSPPLFIAGTTANAGAYSGPNTPCTTSADCTQCAGMDQSDGDWLQTGCGCLFWSCGGGGSSLTGMAEGPADVCGVVWQRR
jgi:hypothetical protein